MNKSIRWVLVVAAPVLLGGCSATPSQVAEGITSFALVQGARHEYIKGCENTWTSDLECNALYDETRNAVIQRHDEQAAQTSRKERAALSRSLADYMEEHQP